MKNIFKTTAVAMVLGGSLVSCNDFLTIDPVDKPVLETFYTSPEALRSTTMALYASKTWSNFHMNFQWKMDMINGDIFYTYSDEGQWYFGTYTSVNPYLNEGWKGLYNVILTANSVINDITPICGGTITQDDINQALGEARALRGYCHYMLAEVWHDVPVIENNSAMITGGNLDVPRNTQASVYRFAMEDLDFAVENLPESDKDAYRLDKRKARALRAKLAVTMASHSDYGYDRAALYAKAAEDALYVIENTTALTDIDFSTLFDVEANNGPESILAIQCAVQGYSFGNAHNVAWSRSSVIADQTWGAGKGPTISLQNMYERNDKRRMWTYMTNGDYYSMLNRAGGGYTYQYVSRDPSGDVLEDRNEMLAHIKKYIIGKSADCDGNVGINQDAANNIYLMRLADVYLTYVEAKMGTNNSTSDPMAMKYYNMVRQRAGIAEASSVTYIELLKERRRELAFESQTWFDTQRYRYREGNQAALALLNSGYETGFNRAAMFVPDYANYPNIDSSNENNRDIYLIVDSKDAGAQYDQIIIGESAFVAPIPAAVSSSSPALSAAPVDYYGGSSAE
ncbi:MAG: RagB/SusD family nutrient uptake outer membrane protein [Muribaculaceae bacterium]|nr:RagB/SusD family nutrient uptake outer membrane protein [Muribaculaceae bacterium]